MPDHPDGPAILAEPGRFWVGVYATGYDYPAGLERARGRNIDLESDFELLGFLGLESQAVLAVYPVIAWSHSREPLILATGVSKLLTLAELVPSVDPKSTDYLVSRDSKEGTRQELGIRAHAAIADELRRLHAATPPPPDPP